MRGEKDEPESLIKSTSTCMQHSGALRIEQRTFRISTLEADVPITNLLGVINATEACHHLHGECRSRGRILDSRQMALTRREDRQRCVQSICRALTLGPHAMHLGSIRAAIQAAARAG